MAMRGACLTMLPWLLLPPWVSAQAALTEVVVTARKVEEPLRDVPMSVQVLSGSQLEQSATTRLQELQFAVPGLVVNTTGMFGVGIALRGVTQQGVGGRSVAPHLDGVPLGSANLAIARLFDIERIEVLKGPQGTLYGADSTGGSLNIITRAPQDTFGAGLELAHGSFATTRARGHLNLPLDDAALRLAFIASEGDGFIRNTADSRRFAEDDYWGLRAALRIDAGERLRVDIMAQQLRDDGGSGELWSPRPDFLANPRDIRLTTVTLDNPFLVAETGNLGVTLEYALGEASLRSISGYARSEVRNVDDCAGLPVLQGCVRSALPNRFDQWTQELQLVFPKSGALEGIVGAYHAEFRGEQKFFQRLPLVNSQPLSDNTTTSRDSATALFGQATLHLADRWSATAGLRLGRQERRVATVGTGFQDSPVPLSGRIRSDHLSWLLDLGYRGSDGLLLYVRASTGYESGGFSTSTIIDGRPDDYGPEHLIAYEVGLKSEWLSGRLALNAAVFRYDYDDLQVHTATFIRDRIVFNVDNAARARIYGLDAEASLAVSERWSVSGGLVWVPEREFIEYRNEVTGDLLSGNTLVRAPEWSATAAVGYERPLGELGRLTARLEYSLRSAFFYTPENDRKFAQDGFGLLGLQLGFEAAGGRWYAFASGRNLADEDYFTQVFLQSSPGQPATWEVGVGMRF